MGGHKKTANNVKNEVTLTSFDGKCHKCGIKGHMSKDCRVKDCKKVGKCKSTRNNQNKGTFSKKCHLCHKKGHVKENCFELEKNASRRPQGWKSCLNGNETSNVAIDEEESSCNNEFVLVSVSDDEQET